MNVENRVINVRIDGSYVTKDSRLAGVQGEGNVTTMRFTFGDSWTGYAKKVTFTNAKGENQTTIELLLTIDDDKTNNNIYECKIPGEALTEPGECTFFVEGVCASDGEQVSRQRSEDETLFVLPGSAGEYDSTATELEQIEWYLAHKVEPIMLDAEKLNNAVDTADKSAKTAVESAQSASAAREAAKQSQKAIENLSVYAESVDPEKDATVEKNVLEDGSVALEFSLPRGKSGVYVGSGDMPVGYNVQIDPSGDPAAVYTGTDEDGNENAVYLGEVLLARGAAAGSLVQRVSSGVQPIANGKDASAFGSATVASGDYAHAEGWYTEATGKGTHAEGYRSKASGNYAHSEGSYSTTASGGSSHAEGENTLASGERAHSEGYKAKATGNASHGEGCDTEASGAYSHAEGQKTKATGAAAHAEGANCEASANYAHAEGANTKATGNASHAEGDWSRAIGAKSHAEGAATKAYSEASHAEGYESVVAFPKESNGAYVVDEEVSAGMVAKGAHAEGCKTFASANGAHSEGNQTVALGIGSHAEGFYSVVGVELLDSSGKPVTEDILDSNGNVIRTIKVYDVSASSNKANDMKGAHAEGWMSTASANGAHAEGNHARALGIGSHAEGGFTEARGKYTHAGGRGTIAVKNQQYVIGQYNEVSETALFIVGCGADEEHRSNAFMVDFDADGNPVYDFGGARFTPDMMKKLAAMLA